MRCQDPGVSSWGILKQASSAVGLSVVAAQVGCTCSISQVMVPWPGVPLSLLRGTAAAPVEGKRAWFPRGSQAPK
jgi:hypothetical protein